MKIVDARSAPVSPNPHGVHASMIHDTEYVQAVHITLQPRWTSFSIYLKDAVSSRLAASERRSWQISSSRALPEFRTVCLMKASRCFVSSS